MLHMPKSRWSSPPPGEESGTYDTFVELVIADISEGRLGEDNDFARG